MAKKPAPKRASSTKSNIAKAAGGKAPASKKAPVKKAASKTKKAPVKKAPAKKAPAKKAGSKKAGSKKMSAYQMSRMDHQARYSRMTKFEKEGVEYMHAQREKLGIDEEETVKYRTAYRRYLGHEVTSKNRKDGKEAPGDKKLRVLNIDGLFEIQDDGELGSARVIIMPTASSGLRVVNSIASKSLKNYNRFVVGLNEPSALFYKSIMEYKRVYGKTVGVKKEKNELVRYQAEARRDVIKTHLKKGEKFSVRGLKGKEIAEYEQLLEDNDEYQKLVSAANKARSKKAGSKRK